MNEQERKRFQVIFEREKATVQEVVGARGMEYLWHGRRFANKDLLLQAMAPYIRDAAQKWDAGAPSPTGLDVNYMLWGIAGALFAFAIAAGFEAVLVIAIENISGRHMVPRGLGWIVFPIAALIGGFKVGPIIGDAIATRTADAVKVVEIRILLAGSAFWTIAVILYVLMFSPFGYYMREKDYWTVAKVISFPIILGIVALAILGWMRKQPGAPRG